MTVSVRTGVVIAAAMLVAAAAAESLPGPVVRSASFELLSNSRYSVHSGFTQDLPQQVLANVLWAMDRVPQFGLEREFYVATPVNVYKYAPAANTLELHKSGDWRYNSGSAFEVGVATQRHEEAGLAVQAGLLAATGFWDSLPAQVASCPMKWATDNANAEWDPDMPVRMVNVIGRADVEGLDTANVAVSSDTTLPRPHVTAEDTFELVMMGLRQDSLFGPVEPSLENVSQLLWAAYGVTPHTSFNGRRGTTIPSAVAAYYLTGRVYVVRTEGVDRFQNRLPPGTNLNTADHRIERVVSGDRRPDLRAACARIPGSAPTYFVIAVSDTSAYGPLQEAGFAALQLLLQARAIGLSGQLTMPLAPSERSAVATALGLPSNQYPVVVFACGEAATGIAERPERERTVTIIRGEPAVRTGILKLEYSLRRSGSVHVEVFDLMGRPVKVLFDGVQSVGYHSVTWDGTDGAGRRVKRGSYVVVVTSGGTVAQHKVAWTR